MVLKDIFKKGFFVYAPFVVASAWILLSVVSIFTIDRSVLSDPFVIISIVSRVSLSLFSLFLIRKLYIVKNLTTVSYNHYLNIVGYSITLSTSFTLFTP
ncbi:MAG: hypothetical protein B6229_10795 [Spirochaetaceae bacterium 4572_7]|nr:MAG: hypothetical protein B6229_10795 [Spirochaetaceae bacterium 4572_7]